MLSKRLVSLIGASIISMSLVGCQSTQSLDEYLESNVDETIWILNTVYDNGEPIYSDTNEPVFYEGTIEEALNNEKDYYNVQKHLDNLYDVSPSTYHELYNYIAYNDLEGLRSIYNLYKDDINANKSKSPYYILKPIRYATSDFTTTEYIGLNRGYLEAIDSSLSDEEWIEWLSMEQEISKYNSFRNNLEAEETLYVNYYTQYNTLCDIVSAQSEEVPMEESNMIWCPMCQEYTLDVETHECTQCGYIPENWEWYLEELGIN